MFDIAGTGEGKAEMELASCSESEIIIYDPLCILLFCSSCFPLMEC